MAKQLILNRKHKQILTSLFAGHPVDLDYTKIELNQLESAGYVRGGFLTHTGKSVADRLAHKLPATP